MDAHQLYAYLSTAHMPSTGEIFFVAGTGFLMGWGTTPGNSVEGWAPGALYIDTDASGDARVLYNAGTATTAVWTQINN